MFPGPSATLPLFTQPDANVANNAPLLHEGKRFIIKLCHEGALKYARIFAHLRRGWSE